MEISETWLSSGLHLMLRIVDQEKPKEEKENGKKKNEKRKNEK
jgi:hypothetical protein